MAFLDAVSYIGVSDIGLKVVLDSRDGLGLFGLVIGDEFGELLFQQFVFGLEMRDKAKDLFQDFAQGQAAVHGGGFPQLVEGVVLLGLGEDFAVDVVDDMIPLPGFDSLGNGLVRPHSLRESVEEHPVDLHALGSDGFFADAGENVSTKMHIGTGRCHYPGIASITTVRMLGTG